MIVDLPDTTASRVQRALVKIRTEGGAVALGRVLTLVIATRLGAEEEAIEAANDASREHPMRVIVVSRPDTADGEARLDAQIRVGGDAGASEVVVLKAFGEAGADEEGLITGMLLPDAPVVAWWPAGTRPRQRLPHRPDRAAPHHRRLDAGRPAGGAAASRPHLPPRRLRLRLDPAHALARDPGRRARPAAVRDGRGRRGVGRGGLPLHRAARGLARVAAPRARAHRALGPVHRFERHPRGAADEGGGDIDLERTVPNIATLLQPGQPTHQVSLPRRSLRDCLAEELRRLDPDDLFGEVLTEGLPALAGQAQEATGTGGP